MAAEHFAVASAWQKPSSVESGSFALMGSVVVQPAAKAPAARKRRPAAVPSVFLSKLTIAIPLLGKPRSVEDFRFLRRFASPMPCLEHVYANCTFEQRFLGAASDDRQLNLRGRSRRASPRTGPAG